jgi:hypothetical protein
MAGKRSPETLLGAQHDYRCFEDAVGRSAGDKITGPTGIRNYRQLLENSAL